MAIHRSIIIQFVALLFVFGIAHIGESQEPARKEPKRAGSARNSTPLKKNEDPGAAAASIIEGAFQGERPPEAARMLAAILRGSEMGPSEGWFGPAETRYTWSWLAKRCGVDPETKAGIPRNKFPGSDALFNRLDRDKDGAITPEDFDWSDRNPYVQMSNMVNRFFRKLNTRGDGQLTKDELLQFFKDAGQQGDVALRLSVRCGLAEQP